MPKFNRKERSMDEEFYVDDFGNLQKRQNLANWTDYEPWQFWGERYNWLPGLNTATWG